MEVTPLEKARQRQMGKTCATCKERTVINGVSYCEKDGKLLHPFLLMEPYGPCPIEQRADGERKTDNANGA